MAPFLPQSQIQAPRNALLDFSPINNAIQSNRQNALLASKMDLEREQMGMQREQHDLQKQRFGMEQQNQIRQKFGHLAQVVDAEQDPAKRAQMWQQMMRMHPGAAGLDKSYLDPMQGPRLLMAEAGLFKTPAEQQTERARLGLLGAQTERERAHADYYRSAATQKEGPPLTPGDRSAILEADEKVMLNRSVIGNLERAIDLSKKAYEGLGARTRATVASNVWGSEGATDTLELDNVVTAQALEGLRATFGANPTEGERKILLDVQGSVNQPAAVRERIYRNAMAAAQRRMQFNEHRAKALRSGTYFRQGAQGAPAAEQVPAAPPAPTRAINPQTGEMIEWDGSQWRPVQ